MTPTQSRIYDRIESIAYSRQLEVTKQWKDRGLDNDAAEIRGLVSANIRLTLLCEDALAHLSPEEANVLLGRWEK